MDGLIPKEVRVPIFEKTTTSPSGRYEFHLEQARVKFTNIIITRGIIRSKEGKILAEIDIQQDPQTFWHCWILSESRQEYLLGKDSDKGALLISMATLKVLSLLTDFSWRSASISPLGDKLAVTCSKESKKPLRVFDFRNVDNPPYNELKVDNFPVIDKSQPYKCEVAWSDNNTLDLTIPVYKDDPLSLGYDYYCKEFTLKIKGPDVMASTRRYDPKEVVAGK